MRQDNRVPAFSAGSDQSVRKAMTSPTSALAGSAVSRVSSHWLTSAAEMAALAGGSLTAAAGPAVPGASCFPRIATRTSAADVRSVRAARDFTLATLLQWGVTGRREDVATVVSELLTNALQHALPDPAQPGPRPPIRLGLLLPGPCVLCAVADPSQLAPEPRPPGHLAETGRGLHVIAALSDQWGYTVPSGTGKVVWAMFSTGPGRLAAMDRRPRGHGGGAEPGPGPSLRLLAVQGRPGAVSSAVTQDLIPLTARHSTGRPSNDLRYRPSRYCPGSTPDIGRRCRCRHAERPVGNGLRDCRSGQEGRA
jgi:hypothetical protein